MRGGKAQDIEFRERGEMDTYRNPKGRSKRGSGSVPVPSGSTGPLRILEHRDKLEVLQG